MKSEHTDKLRAPGPVHHPAGRQHLQAEAAQKAQKAQAGQQAAADNEDESARCRPAHDGPAEKRLKIMETKKKTAHGCGNIPDGKVTRKPLM